MNKEFNFACEFNKITVGDLTIQTYSIGSGDNALICFPAFPHSGLMYLLMMQKYDMSKVKIITLDLPGWIGMTQGLGKGGTLGEELLTEIASAIVKEYRLSSFNVLGFSFGSLPALLLANEKQDMVSRVALVSPVVNGNLNGGSVDAKKVRIVKSLGLGFVAKPYVLNRYRKYYGSLLGEGIPESFLISYRQMIHNADNNTLLQSIADFFTNDHTELVRSLSDKRFLIANSQKETKYFREQAGYLRRILSDEKSVYLQGEHHDFLLHPDEAVVKGILNFLIK